MKIAFVYINKELNVGRGAGYVAASIIQAGHELYMFDTAYATAEELAGHIVQSDYDVLMISSMTMLFPEALRLIHLIKQKQNIPILVGGIHAIVMGKKLLEDNADIDFLCIGEGESMVVEFLEHLHTEKLFTIDNLAYRKNGKVICNAIRPAENLSELPKFAWDYFQKESIVQDNGFLYVTATRGCPYNCTYCSNGVYLEHYGKDYLRFRPIDEVIDELIFLKEKYNPKLFYFGDEMILSDIEYAKELFLNIKNKVQIPYGCMARVECIGIKIVKILKDTNCQYIGMGVECGNENFRKKYLNRHMSNREIVGAFGLVQDADIFATSFNMIGFPFDYDDMLTNDTLHLNNEIKPDYAQVSIFYPFPGTELHKLCVSHDMIDKNKINNTKNYHSESVLKSISIGQKKNEISKILNPNGFDFRIKE